MIFKITYILVLGFVSRVHSSCSDVANEDKIDCVQHESWTPESCVAKGCCYGVVPGFPACYYPFGNKHEARCMISVSERRDCGNADTTEINCIKSGCCWQMSSGGPYCYFGKDVVTDTTTVSTTDSTTASITDSTTESIATETVVTDTTVEVTTTSRGDSTTESTVTENPAECKDVSDEDKIDCASDDPNWSPKSCLAKGCCYIEVAGYPACFYAHGKNNDPKCEMSNGEKKDCGDSQTTATECQKKGCCWVPIIGGPYCFHKKDS